MQFSEILSTLASIDHLAAIELSLGEQQSTRIDNKPGSSGSVRVYHALFQEFGEINLAAAEKGLQLYAEHSADAITFPGKHPNIDRLLEIIAAQTAGNAPICYSVKLIPQ